MKNRDLDKTSKGTVLIDLCIDLNQLSSNATQL